MRPLRQELFDDPETGEIGDCLRTCLRMCLPETIGYIPHFSAWEGGRQRENLHTFLENKGYKLLEFPLVDDGRSFKNLVHSLYPRYRDFTFILSGRSPRNKDRAHAIVISGGRIHDPHPSDDGLAGPLPEGMWLMELIIPYTSPCVVQDP